jgi:hypothetical protein
LSANSSFSSSHSDSSPASLRLARWHPCGKEANRSRSKEQEQEQGTTLWIAGAMETDAGPLHSSMEESYTNPRKRVNAGKLP